MTTKSEIVSTHTIEAVDKATLRTLLERKLIREVRSEGRIGCEITELGMQCIADYDHIAQDSQNLLNHTKPRRDPLLTGRAVELLRSIEAENEYGVYLIPREGVSIFIPTLNEAENIRPILERLPIILDGMPEIIVVDGGSIDETPLVAARHGAKVISQQGTGKGDALRQLFHSNFQGKIVVLMDADGSNRLEEIPSLIHAIVNGADMAKGSRFLKGGGSTDLSWVRRIGNKLFVSMVNLFWGGQYTDLCYGFMAFRKDALAQISPLLESQHFQIETEICIKAKKLGLNVVEVPSVELKRQYGTSKLRGVHDSIRIMQTILDELF
jgi:hypothetical protein